MKHLLLLTLALITCSTQGMVAEPVTKTLELLGVTGPIGTIQVRAGLFPVAELRELIAPLVGYPCFHLLDGDKTLKNGQETNTTLLDFNTLTVVKHRIPYEISLTEYGIVLIVDGKVKVEFDSKNPDLLAANPLEGDFDSLKVLGWQVILIFDGNDVKTTLFHLGFSADLLLYLLEGHKYFTENHSELSLIEIRKLFFENLMRSIDITSENKELRKALCVRASKRYGFNIDFSKTPSRFG